MDPEPLQFDGPLEPGERRVVHDRRDLEVEVGYLDEAPLPARAGESGQVQVREPVLLESLPGEP